MHIFANTSAGKIARSGVLKSKDMYIFNFIDITTVSSIQMVLPSPANYRCLPISLLVAAQPDTISHSPPPLLTHFTDRRGHLSG